MHSAVNLLRHRCSHHIRSRIGANGRCRGAVNGTDLGTRSRPNLACKREGQKIYPTTGMHVDEHRFITLIIPVTSNIPQTERYTHIYIYIYIDWAAPCGNTKETHNNKKQNSTPKPKSPRPELAAGDVDPAAVSGRNLEAVSRRAREAPGAINT